MSSPSRFRSQPQTAQDEFVDTVLDHKMEGTFLDIGCYDCEIISNTWFLEMHRNWSGVGIDIDDLHERGWAFRRPNSSFLCADATLLDYTATLNAYGLPLLVDYLSIDLEPPQLSLLALRKVLESDRRFSVITFETDWYRQRDTQLPSRQLLHDAGYVLAREGIQDDFWVSKQIAENLDIASKFGNNSV